MLARLKILFFLAQGFSMNNKHLSRIEKEKEGKGKKEKTS